MKIHIFGCSGSGKSWLSEKLAAKYGIPHYDLDDIFWDNTASEYGTKTSADKRAGLLSEILSQEDWIVEGVYYSWLGESFEKADRIIVLDIPARIYKYRIIKRFIRRKLGIESGKRESFKSLISLLKWTDVFRSRNLPDALNAIRMYKSKTDILKSVKAVESFVNSFEVFLYENND